MAEGTGRAKEIRTWSGACTGLKAVTGKCQTRHSAERIREIEGIGGGYIKPVRKARTHVPSNLLFRYSLVPVSLFPSDMLLLFSGLPSCIPNRRCRFPTSDGGEELGGSCSACRMVTLRDIRYSITGGRVSLRINRKLSSSSSLSLLPTGNLIISGQFSSHSGGRGDERTPWTTTRHSCVGPAWCGCDAGNADARRRTLRARDTVKRASKNNYVPTCYIRAIY